LVVSAARISVDVGQDLRLRSEPLLASVFEFIEEHYREPISLATVAAAVGLTPGYLTTTVRRKTGRTVQRWITERRMAEARTLLRESTSASRLSPTGSVTASRASSSGTFGATTR
jgi:AraC family transcriptional regulator, transcriptional activator of pobA